MNAVYNSAMLQQFTHTNKIRHSNMWRKQNQNVAVQRRLIAGCPEARGDLPAVISLVTPLLGKLQVRRGGGASHRKQLVAMKTVRQVQEVQMMASKTGMCGMGGLSHRFAHPVRIRVVCNTSCAAGPMLHQRCYLNQ